MGDPSFVTGLAWDNGTAENVSYFPRLDTASCDPVADKSKLFVASQDPARYNCQKKKPTEELVWFVGTNWLFPSCLVVSYCDTNDYYCDGGTSLVVHANYVTKYHSEAVDFVVDLLGGC